MPLEETQMLCTVLWHHAPSFAEECELYKPVHQKHPCTLWAMENKSNYTFAFCLLGCMFKEYTKRYKKRHSSDLVVLIACGNGRMYLPDGKMTAHPQCFSGHDDLKTDEFMPTPIVNFILLTNLGLLDTTIANDQNGLRR